MKLNARIIFAIFLIAAGLLVLLDNLGVLPVSLAVENWFITLLFGGGGLAFLAVLLSRPVDNWWAVIPAFTFFGLAFIVGEFLPPSLEELNGAVFLGMIGLSFWVVLLLRREHWWAVIPGGVLVSLALTVLASELAEPGWITGAVLMLGLAITFLLVYLRPHPGEVRSWPLYPAGILGAMALLLLMGQGWLANLVTPFALILLGSIIVITALRRR